jgi:hypothetical protein
MAKGSQVPGTVPVDSQAGTIQIFPEKTWFYRSRYIWNFRSNIVWNYNNTVEAIDPPDRKASVQIAMVLKHRE